MSSSFSIRSTSARAMVVCGLAVVSATLYWLPAFFEPSATGWGDWQYFHHMWETGYVALRRFGELPLWDPFHCGGITLWRDPQAQVYGPLFLLSAALVSSTIGTKLFVVLHCAVGVAGMFVLTRQHYVERGAPAVVAAAAWGFSGFFAWHVAGGHPTFLPFYFAPWLVWFWRASLHEWRWSLALGGTLALTILEGGVYPCAYFALLLVLEGLAALFKPTQWKRATRSATIALCTAAAVGAVRWIPIFKGLVARPRLTTRTDALSLGDLLTMLTAADHSWRFEGHPFVWPEYAAFIGWTALALGGVGTIVAWRRRNHHLVVGMLLFGALAMGEHGPMWPWPALHQLPIFDSLRVPSRFVVLFLFYAALNAALALDAAVRWVRAPRSGSSARQRWGTVAGWLVAGAVLIEIGIATRPIVHRWNEPAIDTSPPSARHHLRGRANYLALYASYPRQHLGTVACYTPFPWPVSRALWTGTGPQARVVQGEGKLLELRRTTNNVFLSVKMREVGTLALNQNFAPEWRATHGRIRSHRGLLAVELPAGRHDVVVSYQPEELPWSIAITLLGCLGVVASSFFGRRVRSARSRPGCFEPKFSDKMAKLYDNLSILRQTVKERSSQ